MYTYKCIAWQIYIQSKTHTHTPTPPPPHPKPHTPTPLQTRLRASVSPAAARIDSLPEIYIYKSNIYIKINVPVHLLLNLYKFTLYSDFSEFVPRFAV